jgi:hypothetical protein
MSQKNNCSWTTIVKTRIITFHVYVLRDDWFFREFVWDNLFLGNRFMCAGNQLKEARLTSIVETEDLPMPYPKSPLSYTTSPPNAKVMPPGSEIPSPHESKISNVAQPSASKHALHCSDWISCRQSLNCTRETPEFHRWSMHGRSFWIPRK